MVKQNCIFKQHNKKILLRGHKYFINYINIGVWYYCIYILTVYLITPITMYDSIKLTNF